MSFQGKPVHEYFNQLRYMKHKNKLATIESEKPNPQAHNLIDSVHRLRDLSISFHQTEHEQKIN